MNNEKPPRYFQGLINKIQGLSSTAKKSRTFSGCGNPEINKVMA